MTVTASHAGHLRWSCIGVLLCLASAGRPAPVTNEVLAITAPWRYTTNRVDAVGWTAPAYDDGAWPGPSAALFYYESASLPAAKNTPLPPRPGGGVQPCYYFRTAFTLTNVADVAALLIRYLVDDGAVFYLNGAEVGRVRMSAGDVNYLTEANATPPGGDAQSFEVLRLVGDTLRTNVVEGLNVFAVRLHQYGTASSDAVFGASVAAVYDPAPEAELTRGPYLQVCSPQGVHVRWRTSFPTNSLVLYGAGPTSLTFSAFSDAAVTEHEVALSGLSPDTLYYYAVGSSAQRMAGGDESCFFRTHPLPGTLKNLHVWVTGDAGTANVNAEAVRDAFDVLNGGACVDAWLQLGDNAYSSGTDAQYQAAMFDLFAARLRQTVVWTTLANHETYSTDPNGIYPYLNVFSMPLAGECGGVASGCPQYFSFDIGMAHFVSLDSMTSSRASDGPMANWLREDLAATTSRWVIAFFHHPPYTKGSHDSDEEIELVDMRENLVPILEAGGVDLVLCGHSHSYERSFLADGHYGASSTLTGAMVLDGGDGRWDGDGAYSKPRNDHGQPSGHRGAVYAVVGCSGQVSGGTLNHPLMAVSQNTLGSFILDIAPERLDGRYLRETGAVDDWFTLVKTNGPPVAAELSFPVAADQAAALQLAAEDPDGNAVTFALASFPEHGLITRFEAATGAFVYMPAHGSTNRDTFAYTATDGLYEGEPGLVTLNVVPPVDADQDGLPDAWEAEHAATDASGDPDEDGMSNLDEYLAGTDPQDPTSWLRLTAANGPALGFRVEWPSIGGTRYRILYCDGGSAGGLGGAFVPLLRGIAEEMDPHPYGEKGTLAFTDNFERTGAPAHGCRFYRVKVVQ